MENYPSLKSPGRRRCCWLVDRLWPGRTTVRLLRTVMMSAAAAVMMPLLLFWRRRHFTTSSRQRRTSSMTRWDPDLDFRMRTVNLDVCRTARLRSVDTRSRRSCDTGLLCSFTFVLITILRSQVFKHWGQHFDKDSLGNLTGLFITARCCCCCWWGGRHRTNVTSARDWVQSPDGQTRRWRMLSDFLFFLHVLWRQWHVGWCCRRFQLCLKKVKIRNPMKNYGYNFLEERGPIKFLLFNSYWL